jgi:RNA polymerase sigma factor (sigma-70 family)
VIKLAGVVEDIGNGDERGVQHLYQVVSDCARSILYQSVNPQVVDDHVQEVLIIVLGAVRRGELRDANCLMGFVRTIARRQASNHIRGAIVRRRRLIPMESTGVPAAPSHESPEARLAFQQRIDGVRRVLATLCPRDREILIRFYDNEQDSEHICREMRLTATQFRLYKSRALAKCGALCHRIQSTRPLRIA